MNEVEITQRRADGYVMLSGNVAGRDGFAEVIDYLSALARGHSVIARHEAVAFVIALIAVGFTVAFSM
ncbi:MAG: hypothetical protein LUE15_02490 [Oscillospiraceae bacterium]|nr:hypothetical protein [Oscillospiraceae bacterium]